MTNNDILKPRTKAEIIHSIRIRREKRKKRTINKRFYRMLHPIWIERKYARALVRLARVIEVEIRSKLFPELPELQRLRGIVLDAGVDAWSDRLSQIIDSVNTGLDGSFETGEETVRRMANETAKWNGAQWQKSIRSALGVQVISANSWLQPELDQCVKRNSELITSLRGKAIPEIADLAMDGIKTGRRVEAIQDAIIVKFNATKSRAELIARDQVSKLNGDLTRLRQTEIGLSRYTWRTSLDERVRASHRANEGQVFSWNAPPSGTGHPEQDFQCRCTAEPIFSDLKGLLK